MAADDDAEISPRRVGATEDNLNNKLLAALNQLVELDRLMLFVEPVQESFAPNYFTVIKQPMDLCTMYTKILDEEYTGWAGFVSDFELMCENALTYNIKGTKVHTVALRMREKGRRLIQHARQPPLGVQRTLVLTHAECRNHVTPGSTLGQHEEDTTKDLSKRQLRHSHPDAPSEAADCKPSSTGAAKISVAPAQAEVAAFPEELPEELQKSVPELPSRITQVWAALREMQFEVNGSKVLHCEELKTSPTMNATLDHEVTANLSNSIASAQAAEAPMTVLRSAHSLPLLSRTATLSRPSVAPSDPAAAAAAGEASVGQKRPAPAEAPTSKPKLQRSNSSAFMLSWVQPAVQEVHSPQYLERVAKEIESIRDEAQRPKGKRRLVRCVSITQRGDTYISQRSLHAALCASYTVCRAVDQVMAAQYRNAFCCIRPPGHHAGPSGSTRFDASNGEDDGDGDLVGQGFCLINHVAVGARYALSSHSVKRVAIIDWDLHHGNGTQACCLEGSKRGADGLPDMLFCSIHGATPPEEQGAMMFPGTARQPQVDLKRGLVNIPLPAGTKAQQYFESFENILCQAVRDYKPDLIMISAGFDAHKDDMFQFLRLSDTSYRQMTQRLMDIAAEICGGRIISVLEGGYTVSTLAQCCKLHVKTLATYNQPLSLKESKRRGGSTNNLNKLRRLQSGESYPTTSMGSLRSQGSLQRLSPEVEAASDLDSPFAGAASGGSVEQPVVSTEPPATAAEPDSSGAVEAAKESVPVDAGGGGKDCRQAESTRSPLILKLKRKHQPQQAYL